MEINVEKKDFKSSSLSAMQKPTGVLSATGWPIALVAAHVGAWSLGHGLLVPTGPWPRPVGADWPVGFWWADKIYWLLNSR